MSEWSRIHGVHFQQKEAIQMHGGNKDTGKWCFSANGGKRVEVFFNHNLKSFLTCLKKLSKLSLALVFLLQQVFPYPYLAHAEVAPNVYDISAPNQPVVGIDGDQNTSGNDSSQTPPQDSFSAFSTSSPLSQPDSTPPQNVSGLEGPKLEAYKTVDQDHDGVLTAEEIARAIRGLMDSWGKREGEEDYDTQYNFDHYGMVSSDDLDIILGTLIPLMSAEEERRLHVFEAMDGNGDWVLTEEEEQRVMRALRALDTNG